MNIKQMLRTIALLAIWMNMFKDLTKSLLLKRQNAIENQTANAL